MNTTDSKNISNGILRAIAIILGFSILLLFLYKISDVLIYIAIAGVISLIGRPIIRFLKSRLKFKNTFAVIATMLLLLGSIVGLASMFIPLIKSQGENLALLNYSELETNFKHLSEEINSYLSGTMENPRSGREEQGLDGQDSSSVIVTQNLAPTTRVLKTKRLTNFSGHQTITPLRLS